MTIEIYDLDIAKSWIAEELRNKDYNKEALCNIDNFIDLKSFCVNNEILFVLKEDKNNGKGFTKILQTFSFPFQVFLLLLL